MKTLSANGQKWLKFFHVLCSICWIGSAIGMNVLKHALDPATPEARQLLASTLLVLDDLLLYVGVCGCLVTGLLYGVCTKWGFFRHGWLTAKWVLTLAMILLGTFVLGPAVQGNVHADTTWYAAHPAEYAAHLAVTARWGGVQLVLLLTVLYLSVFKPKGRR